MMVENGKPLFSQDRIWALHTRGWVVGVNELLGFTPHVDNDTATGYMKLEFSKSSIPRTGFEAGTALALPAKRARVPPLGDQLLLRALAHRY
jgi:hypothetical protein